MPTPNDQTGTEYIEITDFSPGIHSDTHGSLSPRFTASDTQRGSLFGNGLARVDGTARCHADKTGALVPLPKALATGVRDTISPTATLQTGRAFRYVLDAQVGNSLVDASEIGSTTPFNETTRQLVQTMWGFFPIVSSGDTRAAVLGREYRPWAGYPSYAVNDTPIYDFIATTTTGLIASDSELAALPVGQLCQSRFYYGYTTGAFAAASYAVTAASDEFATVSDHTLQNGDLVVLSALVGGAGVVAATNYYVFVTGNTTFKLRATQDGAIINITSDGTGNVTRAADPTFRPKWMYPVSVAMAATPWVKWGGGNRWVTGAMNAGTNPFYGIADDPHAPTDRWSPAVGLKGLGTTIIGMGLQDSALLRMIFPTKIARWYFHYSESGNVPQNNILEDMIDGPINPYTLIAHQGRIVMPDRRRSLPSMAPTAAAVGYGYMDDLILYSDPYLPAQNTQTTLTADKGVANAAYGEFPQITHRPYNKVIIADDVVANFGAIGVITVDQLLLVKHFGGGAAVSGDLDNPTVHRLPYIESTGGVVCKGANTPIGFVYGSDNGIFTWQGGDSTQRLSPQLDGFFWDHTNGTQLETYAGSRGRMAFWNGLLMVPNNYVYDVESQSWWRLAVQDLAPVSTSTAAYNCYDTDENGLLYAWPYRHIAPIRESHALFPAGPTNLNCLSTPDVLGAGTQRDIRFVIDGVPGTTGAVRTIISQWGIAGNRSFIVRLTAADQLQFISSTDGTAFVTGTCAVAFTPSGQPVCGRVTIDTTAPAGTQVNFFRKPASIPTKAILENNNGWETIGAPVAGVAAPMFNSTAPIVVGNEGASALANPLGNQRFHGYWISPTIDSASPTVEIVPADFPVNEAASTFDCTTGQTITVTRAGAGTALALDYLDQTAPPVWYTFDSNTLDSEYTWQSHPLLETKGHVTSFQTVQLIATGASTAASPPYIEVTLEGFDRTGASVATSTTTLTLALRADTQLLRKDISPNFAAEYVTVKLRAVDPNGNSAPKIHSVRLGTKPRATTARHG